MLNNVSSNYNFSNETEIVKFGHNFNNLIITNFRENSTVQ